MVTDATGRELPARLIPMANGEVVDNHVPKTSPELTPETYWEDLIDPGPFSESPLPSFDGVRIVMDARNAVYPITVDPLLTSPEWTVESSQGGAQLGFSVGTAGDVNGDGYADVIVGTSKFDAGQRNTGWVGVYLGSATGITTTGAWSIAGDQAEAQLGYSVGTAGDVNGDGYAEIIVGAPIYTGTVAREGAAFVYFGSATGITTTGVQTLTVGQIDAQFGCSVGTAGDVNGDTYADVVVGAFHYDAHYNNEGAAFVYLGSSSGITETGVWSATVQQRDAWYGTAVGTAGDVNGDGYADIVVGAPLYDNGEGNEGRIYVYHGSANGLGSNSAWTVESDHAGAWFGRAVGTAGDVNGDTYADIIAGAPFFDSGATDAGQVYVYLGSTQGITTTGRWTATVGQASAAFGHSVGTAGDVNVDGYADVMVGAYTHDGGQADEGAVFIYPGSASGLASTAAWSGESNQANARYGVSAGTAGDVNADGAADVIVGAYGYSNPQFAQGRAYVYHGESVAAISGLAAVNDSPTALGQSTTLTATVSAGTNVSYAWTFGDGDTGVGAVVTHTYPSARSYTAVVTATNSVSTMTITTPVTITTETPVTVTRTITYTYDPLNRLTGATYSTGESYAYQYDAVGNRVALTDTTGTTSYAYDAANRLTSVDGVAYTWDARGNLTHDGVFTCTYDAAGRMVRAESLTATLRYTHTADGLRVVQDVDGAVTTFAWDWATGVPEMLNDGDKRYLVGHDTLGWEDAGGLVLNGGVGWTYALPDALGSVRQVVDATAAVVAAREACPERRVGWMLSIATSTL